MINVTSTFLLVLVAGLSLAALAPVVLGYKPVVVASGSMEPAIKVADVVLTTPSDGTGLDRGTVINYEYGDTTRLHRIVATTEDGYQTAGDANRSADGELVAPSDVRGVGAVVVPFVGLPAVWVERAQWLHVGLALAVLAAALYTSRARWVEPEPLLP